MYLCVSADQLYCLVGSVTSAGSPEFLQILRKICYVALGFICARPSRKIPQLNSIHT